MTCIKLFGKGLINNTRLLWCDVRRTLDLVINVLIDFMQRVIFQELSRGRAVHCMYTIEVKDHTIMAHPVFVMCQCLLLLLRA